MNVFVDTSALYALLDRSDTEHVRAQRAFESLLTARSHLVTLQLAASETSALVQRRLPAESLRDLHRWILPRIEIATVDAALFDAAVAAVVASPTGPSLVDQASFETMRRRGIAAAFAYDRHFAEAGFELV